LLNETPAAILEIHLIN